MCVYFKYCVQSPRMSLMRSLVPLRTSVCLQKQDEICAICLQSVEPGEEQATIRRCGHLYHRACIERWLDQHDRCPKCRRIV